MASPKLAFAISANARVDEPFSARLIVRGGDPDATEIIECTIPDGLGLTYRAADRSVHGTPTRSGDFSLTVRYRFHGTSEDRPQMTANVPLTVNPDPRTLWQDRPSDRNAPGWKPDADGCLIPAGAGRRILAASKRGRSHAHFGGFRDDDFCVRVRDDSPWSLIAVTDGAGSAEQARTGSRIVANVAADFAAERLAGELGDALTLAAKGIPEADPVATRQMRTKAYEVLGGAALAAVKAIEETADRQGLSPRDYATTLLLAAHRMLGDEHIVITFWAGDGAMVVLEEAGATLLGEPDGGAFAGQTRFLDRSIVGDANEIMTRIHVLRVSDLLGLLVMTDGVSDAHFASDQALAEKAAWDAFWGQVQPILEAEDPVADLLRWLDFWSPGNHDDRTIAIFW
ncbi:PP2C family serine/threonine-protein phosphatase [Thioalkalicoccus limnaeus]|uniref:PP2C family serine/threonine-protein phosphatase n=1 Tax=Thioalkalicoccus limnaeus TaxID=120681 RepID=A0ABV4BH63_9GAMM